MIDAIYERRSIRRFQPDPIPRECVEQILRAGIQAPSSKNRQPWRFAVLTGESKHRLTMAMEQGIAREKTGCCLLPNSACHLAGAEHTARIIEQAPVVVLIANPLGLPLDKTLTAEGRVYELANAQSLGACIQNMTLAAQELGLGSLWICDTYFAYEELKRAFDLPGEPAAALALGFADEHPHARPRLSLEEVVRFL